MANDWTDMGEMWLLPTEGYQGKMPELSQSGKTKVTCRFPTAGGEWGERHVVTMEVPIDVVTQHLSEGKPLRCSVRRSPPNQYGKVSFYAKPVDETQPTPPKPTPPKPATPKPATPPPAAADGISWTRAIRMITTLYRLIEKDFTVVMGEHRPEWVTTCLLSIIREYPRMTLVADLEKMLGDKLWKQAEEEIPDTAAPRYEDENQDDMEDMPF